MSVKITDKDHGYRALFKRIGQPSRVLSVGVLSEGGGSGSIGHIATIHEFGLGVPERSFIRGWADGHEADNIALLRGCAQRVLKGLDPDTALNQAGAVMAGGIQAFISSGIAPPLSPHTRSGVGTPLIDTGALRSSISWRVA
jgi:hypothetical protein